MATWTQAQLDALIGAISQGVLEVEYSDKKVKFRSLDDMLRLKDLMEADLGIGKNLTERRTTTSVNKGYINSCE